MQPKAKTCSAATAGTVMRLPLAFACCAIRFSTDSDFIAPRFPALRKTRLAVQDARASKCDRRVRSHCCKLLVFRKPFFSDIARCSLDALLQFSALADVGLLLGSRLRVQSTRDAEFVTGADIDHPEHWHSHGHTQTLTHTNLNGALMQQRTRRCTRVCWQPAAAAARVGSQKAAAADQCRSKFYTACASRRNSNCHT